MMEQINQFKLSPEAQQELFRAARDLAKAFDEAWKIIVEFAEKVMAEIRRIAIELGRFFLKQQLLEWRIPNKIADYVSKNLHGDWAVQLGFGWFRRKFMLIE